MSYQLHPTLESFYLHVLAYAGLKYENGVISNVSEKIGDIKIDDKYLTLPYMDNLRRPENRHIFHPLNESYTSPETAFVDMYKRRLVLEINLKLSAIVLNLLTICSDAKLQQKAKNPKLIALLSAIEECDMTTVEHFASFTRYSQKENTEAFLVDVFLKKNAELGGTPRAAIGKINFLAYGELHRALEDKEGGYKAYGFKLRKKDIVALLSIFEALFNLSGMDKDKYTIGTDHKPFRYFNALLLASYQVASRINEVNTMICDLKEPLLGAEDNFLDLGWAANIEEVYNLTDEIRQIPNQTNVAVESNRLKVKEPIHQPQVPIPTLTQHSVPVAAPAPPVFAPQQAPVHQQQPVATHQQPAAYQQPSPEDIVRSSLNNQQGYPAMMAAQMPMVPMGYQQPGMMMQQQPMMVPAPQGQFVQQQPMMRPMQQQPMMVPVPQGQFVQQQPMMMTPMQQQVPQGYFMTPNGMVVQNPQQQASQGIPIMPFMG